MDIDINNERVTRGIQFASYIALNRYMDKRILKESKLFCLMLYIALRVKRSNGVELSCWDNIRLNIGEFIIGRISTVRDTDLTESEYKTRLKQLQTLRVINILETSNKFTRGKWLENSFIDLNLEISTIQPNSQQVSSGLTTNNNVKNPNNPMVLIINSINTSTYSTDDYVRVVESYMQYKGIELKGNEIKDTFWVIKKMFDSQRTPEEIVRCMKWFKDREDDEEHPWIKYWTINTVQKKLPELLAGKLHIRTWEEMYPRYKPSRG